MIPYIGNGGLFANGSTNFIDKTFADDTARDAYYPAALDELIAGETAILVLDDGAGDAKIEIWEGETDPAAYSDEWIRLDNAMVLPGTADGQSIYWNLTSGEWTPTSLALLSPSTKTIAVDGILSVVNSDHSGEVSLGKSQTDALLKIKTDATQWEAIEIWDPNGDRFMHFVAQGTGLVNGFSMSDKSYFALQNYTNAINYLKLSQTESSPTEGHTKIETFGEVGKRQHLLLKSDGNLWLWPVNGGNILALEDIIPSPADSHAVGTSSFPFASGQFIDFVIENSLGIGIETPLAKLHINGGVGTLATGLALGDGDSGIYESVDDVFVVRNNSVDTLHILENAGTPKLGVGVVPTNNITLYTTGGGQGITFKTTIDLFALTRLISFGGKSGAGLSVQGNTISFKTNGISANLADAEMVLQDGLLGIGTLTPNASLAVNGSQSIKRTDSGAADYNPSALTTDYLISVDNSAAARAVTISSEDVASGTTANPRKFIIKDEEGAAGTYNITITLESGGTIDGAASLVLSGNYDSVTLYIDGTNAFII